MLFSGFVLELSPPCALHCILAHHRYIWSYLSDIAKSRKMTDKLSDGLRKIGCTYLAYQMDRYEER